MFACAVVGCSVIRSCRRTERLGRWFGILSPQGWIIVDENLFLKVQQGALDLILQDFHLLLKHLHSSF
jgi:hypothetical protein